MTNTCKDKQG